MPPKPKRLAFVVTHPIQYYVPLYRRLAGRSDLQIKVFYTWHAGAAPVYDPGFKQAFAWDIPLTEGYEYELVPNRARPAGVPGFFGLRNPSLIDRIVHWGPDAVHITGYAYYSHLQAMRGLARRGIPVVFRGDSHLLDQEKRGPRWALKRFVLNRIYKPVSGFLYVGKNNHDYYRAFAVPESRLFYCPHSIDVDRFAEPNDQFEGEAQRWRKELGIAESTKVLLYAGKFVPKKQPLELMRAVVGMKMANLVVVMVGGGQLQDQVDEIAAGNQSMFRILPFQNQSRMPVVYRLGDVFTLPSAYDETWGLAANEAMASGRRVLLSARVGCAVDVVESMADGCIFPAHDWGEFKRSLSELMQNPGNAAAMRLRARRFNIDVTEDKLCQALETLLSRHDKAWIAGVDVPAKR